MATGALGKVYKDGDVIVQQNDSGNCMYVVQAGKVEVIQERDHKEVQLAVL